MFPVCFGMSVPAATLAAYCALLAATAACAAKQPTGDVSHGTAEAEGPVQNSRKERAQKCRSLGRVQLSRSETKDGSRKDIHAVLIPFFQ
jgi:hypothetical protein